MATIETRGVPATAPDVQAGRPTTEVSLTRVGVLGVEKVISVSERLYFAELECFVDLNPQQAGVHMSRFEEIVNEAIDTAVLGSTLRAEQLAGQIAEQVRERQGGLRAEVAIAARYPQTARTPVTGIETQEIYTLHGTAVASMRGTRTLTGVEAQGMTACPCAQELVGGRSRERLPSPRLPRGQHLRRRRPRPARDCRVVDELGDLRADEARRRGRGGREGSPQPALRRGRRPRDGSQGGRVLPPARRRRLHPRAPGE